MSDYCSLTIAALAFIHFSTSGLDLLRCPITGSPLPLPESIQSRTKPYFLEPYQKTPNTRPRPINTLLLKQPIVLLTAEIFVVVSLCISNVAYFFPFSS